MYRVRVAEAITERPERTAQGYRRFRCRACGKPFNERTGTALNRAHYPSDVIALVVLWCLRYKLSLRDLVAMFARRGVLLVDGETLPIAGGIEIIHVPGHCAGQVALLWRPGRMLFAGDVGTNLMGLGDPVGFESLKEGRASQHKLASLSFDAAGFGHGKPIVRDASAVFRNKWGEKLPA